MRGYKAISQCAEDLSQQAWARLRGRYRQGRYGVPSRGVLRALLMRVDPVELDQALRGWNVQYTATDESLAIDGKTLCNARDEAGRQTHVLGVVGYESHTCDTQKKSVPSPSTTVTGSNKPTRSGWSSHSSSPSTSPAKPAPPRPC
ncbi:MAG: hypothetical protein WAM94_08380 [Chromatiaceae bacterium]